MAISNFRRREAEAGTMIFTGRGNNEAEAARSAELRYSSWQLNQQREQNLVNEISTTYNYKKYNDINYKCELFVQYTITSAKAAENKKSIFQDIYKYLRTITAKKFYSKNNLK